MTGAVAFPATTLEGRLGPVVGSGRFRVERPGSWPRHLLASMLRLPAAGSDVVVTLRVRPGRGGDRWERSFGGRRLVSRQQVDGVGIVERVGPVALRFEVDADGAGLRTAEAVLVAGPIRWRVPAVWTPDITCRVAPGAAHQRVVAVQVATRGGRVLCRYGGVLVDLPDLPGVAAEVLAARRPTGERRS